jgi:hypothetical protein
MSLSTYFKTHCPVLPETHVAVYNPSNFFHAASLRLPYAITSSYLYIVPNTVISLSCLLRGEERREEELLVSF